MVVVVVVDKPVWPKGVVGGFSRPREAEPQSLPIVYVTNADGTFHRSGVACVWEYPRYTRLA